LYSGIFAMGSTAPMVTLAGWHPVADHGPPDHLATPPRSMIVASITAARGRGRPPPRPPPRAA
jgi:hypothetical protein